MSSSTNDISTQESQEGAVARRAAGEFVRGISGVRNWISSQEGTGNGSGDGDTEEAKTINKTSPFQPEPGRYHLFIAYNCPWCHRATLARAMLGLEDSISMDVAFPNRTLDDDPIEAGRWEFNPTRVATLTQGTLSECTYETATGKNLRLAKDIYGLQGLSETSVPIFYDKKLKVVVNNESAEIIRMLATHADALRGSTSTSSSAGMATLAPEVWISGNPEKQRELDSWNQLVYESIGNGAYKAGFSSSQEVYNKAFASYFKALQQLEDHLASDGRPWILGDKVTEVDLRLFPTLYRHDPVYYVRMKLNAARILDYPHVWRWLCRFYALPGVATSGSNLLHCRQGYFGRSWNTVVPLGPLKPMPYPEAYQHPELAGPQGSDKK